MWREEADKRRACFGQIRNSPDRRASRPSLLPISVLSYHFLFLLISFPCRRNCVPAEVAESCRKLLAVMSQSVDFGPTVIAICIALTVVSAIFLGLRMYCKIIRGRRFWWDDYILIAAWVSFPKLFLAGPCAQPLDFRTGRLNTRFLLPDLPCHLHGSHRLRRLTWSRQGHIRG